MVVGRLGYIYMWIDPVRSTGAHRCRHGVYVLCPDRSKSIQLIYMTQIYGLTVGTTSSVYVWYDLYSGTTNSLVFMCGKIIATNFNLSDARVPPSNLIPLAAP